MQPTLSITLFALAQGLRPRPLLRWTLLFAAALAGFHARAAESTILLASTNTPGGLAVGDEPMPLADMLARCQPRQQVGVGRTCLRDPLDRRYQNSTAAALAERTASTGMKR